MTLIALYNFWTGIANAELVAESDQEKEEENHETCTN